MNRTRHCNHDKKNQLPRQDLNSKSRVTFRTQPPEPQNDLAPGQKLRRLLTGRAVFLMWRSRIATKSRAQRDSRLPEEVGQAVNPKSVKALVKV